MAELTFTVDSALLSELGEKLVETAHIALVELVKNAYDADASLVIVQIVPDSTLGPVVNIVDDGSGMAFQDVEKYWMRIATTHKKENDVSPRYGRPRTGSKGIGRFSCRRLGTRLELMTTAAVDDNRFEQTEVSFDWLKFTPGKEINAIKCKGVRRRLNAAAPGTSLKISGGLVDEWSKRGYDFLKRQLAVLAANRGRKRPGFDEDPGFNIRIEAPGFSEEISNLRDRLLTAGWGDLSIRVDNTGKVTCKLNAMNVAEKTITYPQQIPELASVSAKIGIMPVTRGEIRNTDVISKSSLSTILDDWGGVYIRHKGFRVYPFGEPGNDWLRIDRDRGTRKTSLSPILQPFAAKLRGVNPQRALLSLLSSKSYIGDVDIGERAQGFEPKASREGFVGETALALLREVVRFAIDWSTIYREYTRGLAARQEAHQAREELEIQLKHEVQPGEIVATALRVVESEVRNLATLLPTSERQHVLRSLQTAAHAIVRHEASNREELRHLQLVASTSTLLLIFSHEVKALLSWFEEVRISLERIAGRVKEAEAKRLAEIGNDFGATKERLLQLLSMTSLISVNSRKSKAARLTLRPRLERAIRSFDLIRTSYSIDIDVEEVPRTLQVGPMLEAELFSVLLNLLSNAIKSVIAAGGRKKVRIDAERRDSKVFMHFRDSGVGINEEHYEQAFAPFASDPDDRLYRSLESKLNPEDEYIVGTGSGLGLSIAREILSNRGGTIRFVKPSKGWNAEIEVVMP